MKYFIGDRDQERWFRYKVWALDAIIVICVVGYIWLGVKIVQMHLSEPRTKVYNCTWVEIEPDVPVRMREECRRKHLEQLKKENT